MAAEKPVITSPYAPFSNRCMRRTRWNHPVSPPVTSVARLKAEEIKVAGRTEARCYDNILVERLWKNSQIEEVYLRALHRGWEAEIKLGPIPLEVSAMVRPHSSGRQNPNEVYSPDSTCSSAPGLRSGAESVQ